MEVPQIYAPYISERGNKTIAVLTRFVEDECIPRDQEYLDQVEALGSKRWDSIPSMIEPLKLKAKQLGLWNLFLTHQKSSDLEHPNYSNLEYAIMATQLGRSVIAPEVTNTQAPDSGNMEILSQFGNALQKKRWLDPLLKGQIRSLFLMTEKQFSSSNLLNISTSLQLVSGEDLSNGSGDLLVISGTKWFISGAGDPRCKVWLTMVKTDPLNKIPDPYKRHSVILIDVEKALLSGKVFKKRPLLLYGIDDLPHGHLELEFQNYQIPLKDNVLGSIGDGFKIIQARLGPGRLHHTMRLLGVGLESYKYILQRAATRKIYNSFLKDTPVFQTNLAKHKIELVNCQNLCYQLAHQLDLNNNNAKLTLEMISMAKIYIPSTILNFLDWGVQVFGAEGLSQDTPLARMWIQTRTLRLADGPDEVHLLQLGKKTIKSIDFDNYFKKMKLPRGKL